MLTVQSSKPKRGGFTMVELHVALVILGVVITSVMAAHWFGLRMFMHSQMKLEASQEARAFLGKFRSEVLACNTLHVGRGSHLDFQEAPDDTAQRGSAIQIIPGTNLAQYIVYYHDGGQNLKRFDTDSRQVTVVARYVSNNVVFAAKDFTDTVITNRENNRVIEVDLHFYRDHDNQAGGLHNYYHIRAKATRRKVL